MADIKFSKLAKSLPESIHIECKLDYFDQFVSKNWPEGMRHFVDTLVDLNEEIRQHFGYKNTSLHIFIARPSANVRDWYLMVSIKTVLRPEPFVEKLDSFDTSKWDGRPIDYGRYYYTNFDPSIYDFVGLKINQPGQ